MTQFFSKKKLTKQRRPCKIALSHRFVDFQLLQLAARQDGRRWKPENNLASGKSFTRTGRINPLFRSTILKFSSLGHLSHGLYF